MDKALLRPAAARPRSRLAVRQRRKDRQVARGWLGIARDARFGAGDARPVGRSVPVIPRHHERSAGFEDPLRFSTSAVAQRRASEFLPLPVPRWRPNPRCTGATLDGFAARRTMSLAGRDLAATPPPPLSFHAIQGRPRDRGGVMIIASSALSAAADTGCARRSL